MLIFRNAAALTEFRPSPEEMQAELQKWNQWIGGLAAQGKLGNTDALMPVGRVVTGRQNVVTDGPFIEGKEIVGGYAVVSADTIDEAIVLANGCPIYDVDGSVEVRPLVKFA